MLQGVLKCDMDNIINSAKIRMMGDLHATKAKALMQAIQTEVNCVRRSKNTCIKYGVQNLAKAIGGGNASSLTCVIRDKDTTYGGTKANLLRARMTLTASSNVL